MSETVSWASSPAVAAAMRGNRNRDTRPELAVRRAAHALGLRYRVAIRPEPTLRRTADLVFPRQRVAVFIDGCFWHRCPVHFRPSSANASFWEKKIAANQARDAETNKALTTAGWSVLRAWEHEDPAEVAERIAGVVRKHLLGPPGGLGR